MEQFKHYFRKYTSEIIVLITLLILTFGIQRTDPYSDLKIINSDGRGYYAYLPATFIQKDLSFKSTYKAEQIASGVDLKQLYLIKNKEGKTYNKYYPGVAMMQLPSFCFAYLIEYLRGEPISGYSSIFFLFFQLTSIVYGVLGFYFLKKYLTLNFTDTKAIRITSLAIYFGTTLFYQIVFTPSLSHHYSFFLFAVISYLALKYLEKPTLQLAIFAGFILGLIVLIRPVNILIIFAIPFILGSRKNTKQFFKHLFTLRNKHFVVLTSIFILFLTPIFYYNYQQIGHIINWSYQSEGFNFRSPKIFEQILGFRTGFLLHTPLGFVGVIGFVLLITKNSFQAITGMVYFFIVTFILSSWWSWDFGGFIGNRMYTEHLVFLAVPITHFILYFKKKWIPYTAIGLASSLMILRIYQLEKGIIQHRFTAETYFKSLTSIDKEDQDKFAFPREVQPYGRKTNEWHIISNESVPLHFTPDRKFGFTNTFVLPQNKLHKTYYFQFKIKKQLDEGYDFRGVRLVMDATDTVTNERLFATVPLYEYYLEGTDEIDEQIIQQAYFANGWNNYDVFKCYILNNGQKAFTIHDFEMYVEEYTP